MPSLLDTNILSELRRPRPEPKVVRFVALVEIRFGIELVSDPQRRAELQGMAGAPRAADVRGTDAASERRCDVEVVGTGGSRPESGHTYSQPDLILAATALHYRLTVVTRDRGEYDRAGVAVINPWDEVLPLVKTKIGPG